MTAREDTLSSIRTSLRRKGVLDPSIGAALEERLTLGRTHARPSFSGAPVEHFVTKVNEVAGTVARVEALSDVPAAIGEHLAAHSWPSQLVVSRDRLVDQIDWPEAWSVEVRAATGADQVAVTGVLAAVAETGTLMLVSSPEAPTTLRFLPDDHIVIVAVDQIVPYLEDAWTELRRNFERMPRAVNLVTGPSKTADVEQTLQVGAHGPRRLHVILVEQAV